MVEVSEVFQQPKFQSLCHDLLFHCRFLFVFCLWYFKQTVILIIYSFFMFYSMVAKCMTRGRRFQYFFFVMLVSLYHVISCDVINNKNFREILRYFFKFWLCLCSSLKFIEESAFKDDQMKWNKRLFESS